MTAWSVVDVTLKATYTLDVQREKISCQKHARLVTSLLFMGSFSGLVVNFCRSSVDDDDQNISCTSFVSYEKKRTQGSRIVTFWCHSSDFPRCPNFIQITRWNADLSKKTAASVDRKHNASARHYVWSKLTFSLTLTALLLLAPNATAIATVIALSVYIWYQKEIMTWSRGRWGRLTKSGFNKKHYFLHSGTFFFSFFRLSSALLKSLVRAELSPVW